MGEHEREWEPAWIDDVRALRQEIRLLRTGKLVARLTEVEREEIAERVAERLEPMLAALAKRPTENPPKRREKPKRSFFRDDD